MKSIISDIELKSMYKNLEREFKILENMQYEYQEFPGNAAKKYVDIITDKAIKVKSRMIFLEKLFGDQIKK